MSWLEPVTLVGETIRLEPLAVNHERDLIAAVRDGELWQLWYTSVPDPTQMNAEIARRLSLAAAGSMLPFAVIERATNLAVGTTTYMNVDAVNRRVEIGSTWYRKRVQRTGDRLGCIAVEFRTSSFNFPSRAAIERLGAKRDRMADRSRSFDGEALELASFI